MSHDLGLLDITKNSSHLVDHIPIMVGWCETWGHLMTHVIWCFFWIYPLVNQHSNGKLPCLMGKSTISMAMFHCYVSSPEGKKWDLTGFKQKLGFSGAWVLMGFMAHGSWFGAMGLWDSWLELGNLLGRFCGICGRPLVPIIAWDLGWFKS